MLARALCLGVLLLAGLAPLAAHAQHSMHMMGMPPGFPGGMSSSPPDSSSSSSDSSGKPTGAWMPSEPLGSAVTSTNQSGGKTNDNGIQLSFQGANIDMVVQWLAETTGKTVIKDPQVQCQLTITSPKKVLPREAVNLVYRALAMQCESYPQQGSFRGRYDADYCEQAIQAWGDAPLQLVIIDHQNALPAPDTPASR